MASIETIPRDPIPAMRNDCTSNILQDTFWSFPKAKTKYDVTLSLDALTFSEFLRSGEQRKSVIPVRDLTGCQVMKGNSTKDSNAYICVYFYPKRKKTLGSKFVRRRETATFVMKNFDTYDENINTAQMWASTIRDLAQGKLSSPEHFVPTRKPFLVLLNPCSGPGKALQMFQERVVPMLAEACVPYHLLVTDHASHATEICQSMDLSKWYGIVIMSGDGLIYEAINGLMLRDDWEQAIKTPIGCLPGGSGNALCCSLNSYAGEPVMENPLLHSTYLLLKHQVMPMDLVAVDTLDGRIYSFLSVMWGLISDVDIESERYRYLGDARFFIGTISRVLKLRTYRGKISFLPKKPYGSHQRPGMLRSHSTIESSDIEPVRPVRRSESMMNPVAASVGHSLLTNGIQSEGDVADVPTEGKLMEDSIAEEGLADLGTVVPPSGSVNGTALSVKGASDSLSHAFGAGDMPTTLLPPLDKPLPANWVTLEDEFITISMTYQSHLSRDLNISPQARLDDGVIHLSLLRAGISKMRLIDILSSLEDGSHIELEGVENIEVLAVRLEPISPNGTLMVDGEKAPYGPIQAQILPSLGRVMGLSK